MVDGMTAQPSDSLSNSSDVQVASITYDRRISDELMAALVPGGFAHSLVEYARSGQFGLDLGLRSSRPKSTRSWATLYAGTTKALDLAHHPGKGFRLTAHPSWTKNVPTGVWKESWGSVQSADQLDEGWADVERFIEACIDAIAARGSHLKEGIVQAGLSRFPGPNLVIDREVVMGFTSAPIRNKWLNHLRTPLALALDDADPQHKWLASKLTSRECDALAITPKGHLLAIEVKPDNVGSAAAMAPLQAWLYARQIQAWIDQPHHHPDSSPHDVLIGMYRQRRQLGLVSGPSVPNLATPLRVIPAIAIRPGHSPEVKKRLKIVAELLASNDAINDPAMRFYFVNLVGRLDEFEPLSLE